MGPEWVRNVAILDKNKMACKKTIPFPDQPTFKHKLGGPAAGYHWGGIQTLWESLRRARKYFLQFSKSTHLDSSVALKPIFSSVLLP